MTVSGTLWSGELVLRGIEIPQERVADFCRRNRIARLALFGSVLREDFGPQSDVDVLVRFEPDAHVGLFELTRMELELSDIVGRKVDLSTPGFLSPYFRDEAVAGSMPIYAAA